MDVKRKAQIWLVIIAILFVGFTFIDMYRERDVANILIHKDFNALYRLKTVSEDSISDSMALTFINSEITHIEHGIKLLSPSLFDILSFLFGALIFGYACYYYGKAKMSIGEG